MAVPKNMVLSLVKRGLESGEISLSDLQQLIPQKKSSQRVPRDIRKAAKVEAERHSLIRDGLRFSVRLRDAGGYRLYLLNADSCTAVGRRLGETFDSVAELPAAADRVVENYLRQLTDDAGKADGQ